MIDFSKRRGSLLRIFLILSFVLVFFFLFWPKPTSGYGQSEEVDRLCSYIKINSDSSLDINQEISFLTDSDYLYWIVPYPKIKDLEIKEQGKIIFPTEIRKESERTIIFWRSIAESSYYHRSASISYHLPPQINFHRGRQISQIVIWRELGLNIRQAKISVSYPEGVTDVRQRFFAIHGIGKAELVSSQPSLFEYRVDRLSPYAIFSINLSFPAGALKIPLIQKVKIELASLSLETVFLISLIFPLLTYLFLFTLYRNHIYTKDIKEVGGFLDHQPDQLEPPLVEMLAKGRVTEKGIGSLIFQLLGKGYLTIIDRGKKTIIGKIKEPDEKLSRIERLIIKILFKQQELRGGLSELRKKKSRELFDQLVGRLYSRIGYLVNREGYFLGDSGRAKSKILREGIIIFFMAVLLAILFLFFIPSSPWLALTPASLVVASLMIIRMRSVFTIRTPKGQEELVKWLKYRNYLSQDYPLAGAHRKGFEKALPWAYLFQVSDKWLEKFTRYPLAKPKWFVTSQYGLSPEDWLRKTSLLVDRLAREIAGLKPPS